MILLADSGSTKTSWTMIDENKELGPWETIGLNPFYHDAQSIHAEIVQHLVPHITDCLLYTSDAADD